MPETQSSSRRGLKSAQEQEDWRRRRLRERARHAAETVGEWNSLARTEGAARWGRLHQTSVHSSQPLDSEQPGLCVFYIEVASHVTIDWGSEAKLAFSCIEG